MKNLLYIIGLVAVVAVIIAVVKTNKTEVEVPASELNLPTAEDMMVQEIVTEENPISLEGDALIAPEGETAEVVVEPAVTQ